MRIVPWSVFVASLWIAAAPAFAAAGSGSPAAGREGSLVGEITGDESEIEEVEVLEFEAPLTGSRLFLSPPAHPAALNPLPLQRQALPRPVQAEESDPSVAQVRQAAIRYAEVDPAKISGWRRRAALSGWMPRVTLNLDRDSNRTVASATASGKTAFFVGPDDRSAGFGVDFSWALSELIWNPDQVSIDTRSRLMVQLRRDIVDEVTRLYFERKRLASEFAANPAGDERLLSERRLRLEELEAQIDGLTGGEFSKMRQQHN
jgi:hypothetical protein